MGRQLKVDDDSEQVLTKVLAKLSLKTSEKLKKQHEKLVISPGTDLCGLCSSD
jgi:hypothetical protein